MGLIDLIIETKIIGTKKQLLDLSNFVSPKHEPFIATAAGGGADFFEFKNTTNKYIIILSAVFINSNLAVTWNAAVYPGGDASGDLVVPCKNQLQAQTYLSVNLFDELHEPFVMPPGYYMRIIPNNPFPNAGNSIGGSIVYLEVEI